MIGSAVFVFDEGDPAQVESAQPLIDPAVQAQIQATVGEMSVKTRLIKAEISKAIIGQREIIAELLTAIVSNGHVLMIGMPGLAKTMMIRTVSEVLELEFRRIQFTPDLMPSDITGTDILEVDEATGHKEYRFIKGPIFSNILLAGRDQPHAAQDAGRAARSDAGTSGDRRRGDLPARSAVLCAGHTESHRTGGHLSAARKRSSTVSCSAFTSITPREEDEETIAKVTTTQRRSSCRRFSTPPRSSSCSKRCATFQFRITWSNTRRASARATRPSDPRAPDFIKKWLHCGAGPRATQYLVVAAKARAVIDGRLLVTSDDVRAAARPVLRHRMFTNFHRRVLFGFYRVS